MIDHLSGGRLETVEPPFVLHDVDVVVGGLGPDVGQHSDEVPAEVRVSAAQRERMRATGIVA